MSIKAVIFDLDGTLLNTLQDIGESMNEVLKREALPVHELEKYRYFVGEGVRMLVKRALPYGSSEEQISDSLGEMKKEYQKRWDRTTRPYEGIRELIKELKNRKIELAVFSNKPHEFTVDVVNRYFEGSFSTVLGAGEFPVKPDPAGVLHIKKILGLADQEMLYVGDSGTDMKTAKAASLYAVGVLWGFRPEGELKSAGADRLIELPSDLLEVI